MNIKVSVIIPVYNAEKYLISCLDSLTSQTLEACEFIFINDGSKDQSGQIIEDYSKNDPRIKLIHQENKGVSMARNAGLQAAVGEFIGFVDADDYIETDMYATLYNAALEGNFDVVISNFESEIEGHKVITRYPFPLQSILAREYIEREILTYFLKSDQLNTACNKLYKRKVIHDNDLKFPEKVALGEDGLFNMQFFRHALSAMYIDYTGYHYREVAGSATRNILEKDYFKRALEVYTLEISDWSISYIDPMKIKQLRSIRLINSVMAYAYVYLKSSNELSFSQRLKYVSQMIANPHVREALPFFYNEVYGTLGRYEKFIVDMIHRKSIIGLYCGATYSKLRNKSY
ncbi:glycosyltransferase [Paenibacillus alginolyticus]|uniref:Glycosyltransferase n=1 Tax=Paenibacillus alginolyticus TaxID=59839 RepID=A0ABT4G8W1_9BACL|nr:glycosyltransferase [Paenibacillus alginolyticus]MCY9692626.1 glycosyltransferase [Paenibacillus alginolyticus]MEC0143833.1 glycosyltransferase [Paenibacillus alginolyticus]